MFCSFLQPSGECIPIPWDTCTWQEDMDSHAASCWQSAVSKSHEAPAAARSGCHGLPWIVWSPPQKWTLPHSEEQDSCGKRRKMKPLLPSFQWCKTLANSRFTNLQHVLQCQLEPTLCLPCCCHCPFARASLCFTALARSDLWPPATVRQPLCLVMTI